MDRPINSVEVILADCYEVMHMGHLIKRDERPDCPAHTQSSTSLIYSLPCSWPRYLEYRWICMWTLTEGELRARLSTVLGCLLTQGHHQRLVLLPALCKHCWGNPAFMLL